MKIKKKITKMEIQKIKKPVSIPKKMRMEKKMKIKTCC